MQVMEDFYTRVLEFTVTDRGRLPIGTTGKFADWYSRAAILMSTIRLCWFPADRRR